MHCWMLLPLVVLFARQLISQNAELVSCVNIRFEHSFFLRTVDEMLLLLLLHRLLYESRQPVQRLSNRTKQLKTIHTSYSTEV
jgi:hypothetical protein